MTSTPAYDYSQLSHVRGNSSNVATVQESQTGGLGSKRTSLTSRTHHHSTSLQQLLPVAVPNGPNQEESKKISDANNLLSVVAVTSSLDNGHHQPYGKKARKYAA